jgi:hypothetical protein
MILTNTPKQEQTIKNVTLSSKLAVDSKPKTMPMSVTTLTPNGSSMTPKTRQLRGLNSPEGSSNTSDLTSGLSLKTLSLFPLKLQVLGPVIASERDLRSGFPGLKA